MGGKRLKFPARQKFKPQEKEESEEEMPEEEISEEEHQKRLKLLKEIGLVKD